jgi:hypothetical protein
VFALLPAQGIAQIRTPPVRRGTATPVDFISSIAIDVTVRVGSAPTLGRGAQSQVTGGDFIEGTLTLVKPAVANGVTIKMASSNINVAATPNVVFLAGEVAKRFKIGTYVVTQDQLITFWATAGGDTASTVLLVRPPRLSRVSLSASDAQGGDTLAGTLTFTGAPSAIGMSSAKVTSDNPAVYVPYTVTVPNGANVAPFRVIVRPVAQLTAVTITATFAGEAVDTRLMVRPPVLVSANVCNTNCFDQWPLPAALNVTVILSGPAPAGGVTVKLTHTAPASVQIPPGTIVPQGQKYVQVPFVVAWGTPLFTATVTASAGDIVVGDGFSVTLPDLSITKFDLFDKFNNAITKPPALDPFNACVPIGITGPQGTLSVTTPLPAYTVRFDYKLSSGTGRTAQVTPTGTSIYNTRACFQISGVPQGQYFDLEAMVDDANVIPEYKESNNNLKKRFTP